ncbi:MAG TPA: nuclear transport factor 2 family protein [Clostridia bacterium]|nr:nuclear transport factor 2 family protein [Clostridia bacterium]
MHHAVTAIALLFVVGLIPAALHADESEATEATIIRMERAALDRWGNGDPDGFLEISAPDVTYFNPFQSRRLNGIGELRKVYDEVRGKIKLDRYELIDPKVQVCGDTAILTFNFVSHGSEGVMRWNTTEVYRLKDSQWRIIHTHWSLMQTASTASPEK